MMMMMMMITQMDVENVRERRYIKLNDICASIE